MTNSAIEKQQLVSYRPEIDGLRALAVVAVIINHIHKDWLPSGYLGVDVFFVISGYVITSSLLRKESDSLGDFLTGFYVRRMKRLIPALIFFVVTTSVLIALVSPEPRVALGIGWRSLFGISNLQLYKSATDYFSASTELNPFIHTWSLGVEEQFYLFFPLLVWFSGFARRTKNSSRNLFFLVGVISVLSLIAFVYLYPRNEPAAYFLMPPRFWEMAAGCIVFLIIYRRAIIASLLKKIPTLLIISLLGAAFFFPKTIPVPATIIVVSLTMLLLGSLAQGTFVYRMLTLRKVMFIGVISYSLYLWHWGVLAISRWTIGIHWWSLPILLALMFALAIFSFNFIETPIRVGFKAKRWVIALAGGVSTVASFVVVQLVSKYSTLFYLDQSEPLLQKAQPLDDEVAKCSVYNNVDLQCGFKKPGNQNTIFLIGDSHIDQFSDSVLSFAKEHGFNLIRATGGGCPFPVSPSLAVSDHCRDVQRQIETNLINQARSGDLLFLSIAITSNFLPTTGEDGKPEYPQLKKGVDPAAAIAEYKTAFERLSQKLNAKNVNVVFFLDGPKFPDVLEAYAYCKSPWFSPWRGNSAGCVIPKRDFLAWRDLNFGWLKSWEDNRQRFVMDGITKKSCDDEECHARYYIDSNHFDRFHTRYVFDSFLARSGRQLLSR